MIVEQNVQVSQHLLSHGFTQFGTSGTQCEHN